MGGDRRDARSRTRTGRDGACPRAPQCRGQTKDASGTFSQAGWLRCPRWFTRPFLVLVRCRRVPPMPPPQTAGPATRPKPSTKKQTLPYNGKPTPVTGRDSAAPPPARLPLLQEGLHVLAGVGQLAGRGHHLNGVGVGLRLVQVDLRVQGL